MSGLVFWWTGESRSTVICQELSWRGQLGQDSWVQTSHDPSRRTRTLALCLREGMAHGLSKRNVCCMTRHSNKSINKQNMKDIHLRQRHCPFSLFPVSFNVETNTNSNASHPLHATNRSLHRPPGLDADPSRHKT